MEQQERDRKVKSLQERMHKELLLLTEQHKLGLIPEIVYYDKYLDTQWTYMAAIEANK
ncbi:hypothetical protein HZA33_04170 [Candidatus Pacearchaeota archaeon]|nr:hypothetical protein [Candidatus Pacearchaeota archaeon]